MNSIIVNIKKIIIIDDHPIIFNGLKQLLIKEQDLKLENCAISIKEIKTAIKKIKPDLIIVDLNLKIDVNGIELTKLLTKEFPHIRILILSMYDEEIYAERAIQAGACGYIMKQEMTKAILHAIRSILNGQIFLSDKMKMRLSG